MIKSPRNGLALIDRFSFDVTVARCRVSVRMGGGTSVNDSGGRDLSQSSQMSQVPPWRQVHHLAELTADEYELLEERSAILEFDAEFPRAEAEERAWHEFFSGRNSGSSETT